MNQTSASKLLAKILKPLTNGGKVILGSGNVKMLIKICKKYRR